VNLNNLRDEISKFLHFNIPDISPEFETTAITEGEGCNRLLIHYSDGGGGGIPAFLLLPKGTGPFPAVLAHHQHNSEWHLGKSEVAGLAGDPLQAFGPALAKQGIVVLARDSLCFEDRRQNQAGLEPDEAEDWLQHYNERYACQAAIGQIFGTRFCNFQDVLSYTMLKMTEPRKSRPSKSSNNFGT
jgi:hypothetical protein